MMAVGCGQGVCGIEMGEHDVGVDVEHALHHGGHLFLACLPVSGYGLLDGFRSVLMDGDFAAHGGGYGHSLCASEF